MRKVKRVWLLRYFTSSYLFIEVRSELILIVILLVDRQGMSICRVTLTYPRDLSIFLLPWQLCLIKSDSYSIILWCRWSLVNSFSLILTFKSHDLKLQISNFYLQVIDILLSEISLDSKLFNVHSKLVFYFLILPDLNLKAILFSCEFIAVFMLDS